jgi:hypothetical protein
VVDGTARGARKPRGPLRTVSSGAAQADGSGDGYGRDVLAPPQGSVTR